MRVLAEGAFEIADARWPDDHHACEINLDRMTATFWVEGADDDWTSETYPIRRQQSGLWEYYEDEDRWRVGVGSFREGVNARKREPVLLFPARIQADLMRDAAQLEKRLTEYEVCGPGWMPFEPEMSDAIEERWQLKR